MHSAPPSIPPSQGSLPPSAPMRVTLLELVAAVSEYAVSEREVIATVIHLLRSGRVRLCGNFEGATADSLCH